MLQTPRLLLSPLKSPALGPAQVRGTRMGKEFIFVNKVTSLIMTKFLQHSLKDRAASKRETYTVSGVTINLIPIELLCLCKLSGSKSSRCQQVTAKQQVSMSSVCTSQSLSVISLPNEKGPPGTKKASNPLRNFGITMLLGIVDFP